MNRITIHKVDDHIVQGLKRIAWRRGKSLDESLRRLLRDAAKKAHVRFRTEALDAAEITKGLPVETD